MSFASVVLGLAAGGAGLAASALAAERLSEQRDERRYAPPGRLIPVPTSGGRLHVRIEGAGAPSVVLDSSLAGSSLSWHEVQPRVAKLTRVLSYDRAGFGWSDATRSPRTIDTLATELLELLAHETCASLAPGPYVLVGHSYGGWLSRLFAARHPERVAGLVLVDEPDPSDWAEPDEERRQRVRRGARITKRFALAARFGLARLALHLGARGRLPSPLAQGATDAERDRVFSLIDRVPAELRPALRSFWSRPKSYEALASQIANVPESARIVAEAGTPFGAIPVTALTAANPTPKRLREREALLASSRDGRHVIAERSGHFIPLEEPQLVVDAVLDVVCRVRRELAVSRT